MDDSSLLVPADGEVQERKGRRTEPVASGTRHARQGASPEGTWEALGWGPGGSGVVGWDGVGAAHDLRLVKLKTMDQKHECFCSCRYI